MRLRIFSRGAAWCLEAFFVLLGIASVWAWFAMVRMRGKTWPDALERLDSREGVLRDELRADVEMLAAHVGDRSVRRLMGLHASADRIASAFESSGFTSRRQTFNVEGVACDNVEAEIAGMGYRAIMVTDTAPLRYPYYHTTSDTPDKLDYDRMARVVGGLERVVGALADGT